MNMNEFHYLLGQTVMCCQIIEHDVKMIYAAMLKGDFTANLKEIENEWTLGQTIKELEELDNSDGNSYFSKSDYSVLRAITGKRNYYCHQVYLQFVYIANFERGKTFAEECAKLKRDNIELNAMYKKVESARMNIMRKYGRI